jgi:hypothetical protein
MTQTATPLGGQAVITSITSTPQKLTLERQQSTPTTHNPVQQCVFA